MPTSRSEMSNFRMGTTENLVVHRDMLWIGYGDGTRNMGSVPRWRYYPSPSTTEAQIARVEAEGQGAPQRTAGDTGEEQVGHFRLLSVEGNTTLWQAGADSTDADELWTQAKPAPERLIEGNVFRLDGSEGEPFWTKYRSVAGGEHVHDIAAFDGALWSVGSGSDHRGEWEGGQIFRYLWRSDDGGKSFQTHCRFMYPDLGKGDTRFRRLLVIDDTMYAFGYVNPFVDGDLSRGVTLRCHGVAKSANSKRASLRMWWWRRGISMTTTDSSSPGRMMKHQAGPSLLIRTVFVN